LSAAIVSENFRPSSTFEQVFEPVQVPESVLLITVPLNVREQFTPFIVVEPFTSQQVWVIVTGAGSPYTRSLYFVHAVLRSWLPAMPSSAESHAPLQMSLSGHEGVVVVTTGVDAAVVDEGGVVAGWVAGDEVQPAVSRAMQRTRKSTQTMPERFILC
jgi:hypothetical protein